MRDGRPGSNSPGNTMAAKLDGGVATKRVGTALLLKVMPGDRFDISVNTYHDGGTIPEDHAGAADIVASLGSALLGGQNYDGIPLNELPDNVKTIQGIFDNPGLAAAINALHSNDDAAAPKAHLNWLFFNDKMELVTGTSGSAQVPYAINGWFTIDPGTAQVAGNPSNQVIATLPGYAIVYIDNQTIGKEVWFDNLMVGHYTSEVVEENHYYPFGLTLQTDVDQNVTGQPYKYNGKELEKRFDLETYEYGARQYNSQIGRWNGIDPLADKYYSISPFVYVANRPVVAIDPDGMKILFVNGFHSDNVVGRNVIGSGKGGEAYWGKGFSTAAQGFFNDHSKITSANYIDGSSKFGADMSGSDRYNAGRTYAENNLNFLVGDIKDGETFKMVTHSEGAAYGAGVASYLIEKGYTVETVAHLSPDEADEFTTPSEPTTYYLSYNGDWITSNMTMRVV